MSADVSFKAVALRATERDAHGELGAVVLRRRFKVRLTPVITPGHTQEDYFACGCLRSSYRGPDTLNSFEFELTDRRLWRRDPELRRVLTSGCALEFWTEDKDGLGWIRWLYPNTIWSKAGWGRYAGTTCVGESMTPDELPGQEMEVGGWWKTETPPPGVVA